MARLIPVGLSLGQVGLAGHSCRRRGWSNFKTRRRLTEGIFSGWLNTQWNRVDSKRVKEVGPDRACAEWLLRCGGACRLIGRASWLTDYNALVNLNLRSRIEAIDASGSCVNATGFRHLEGLTELRFVKIDSCHQVTDTALQLLATFAAPTLQRLILSNCGMVSDVGLQDLVALKKLEILELFNLPGVENLEGVVGKLKAELRGCQVRREIVDKDLHLIQRDK